MTAQPPEWLFNEADHVGVDYADPAIAAEYDRHHQTFRDFAEEARRVVAALGLGPESTVLDIGCGTGGLALHLASHCAKVYAADVSAAMIGVFREKIERQGLSNVTAVEAGFLTYEHHGPTPDAIVVNVALHHLPDFWKQLALCRLHDLLKPGGRLFLADVVFDFDPHDHRQAIDAWLAAMGAASDPQMAAEAIIHVRDEFSTWDWVLTGMLERAGFRVDSADEIMPLIRAYICSRPGS